MLRKYLLSNKQGKKVYASGTVLIEESQAGQVGFELARRVAECRDRRRRWGAVQAWGKQQKEKTFGRSRSALLCRWRSKSLKIWGLCGYMVGHRMLLEGETYRPGLVQCTTTDSQTFMGLCLTPRDSDSVGVGPRKPVKAPR